MSVSGLKTVNTWHSLADQSFDYVIKRQRRKTIALHILADASVELRAPQWVAKAELVNFVEQRSAWIIAQRLQVQSKLALIPGFDHGEHHFYLGRSYPLQLQQAARARVELRDNVFFINTPDPSQPLLVQKALENWYRKQAKNIYDQRMINCFEGFPAWFKDQYQLPTITIRKMRRRWGSCSRKGSVTMNLSLIKMPVACIDYVLCHELCHLEAFHHGKAFYNLLASVMHDWRDREILIEQLA